MILRLIVWILFVGVVAIGQQGPQRPAPTVPPPQIDYPASLAECTVQKDAVARYANALVAENAKLQEEIKKLKDGK